MERIFARKERNNPSWGRQISWEPARITAVVVVHVPELRGYYSQMLEIVDRSLRSLRAGAPGVDLLVFDNGSCSEVAALLRGLQPEFLVRSERNIGAVNALFQAVKAAPGQVIAYSDYDVLFLDGWLDPQLRILEEFDAGMVSGNPAGFSAEHCNKAAADLPGVEIHQDPVLLKQWIDSVGWSTSETMAREKVEPQRLIQSESGVRAVVGARHYQFLAWRDRLLQIDPGWWTDLMSGHVEVLDEAVDAAGWLRLCTPGAWVFHMGNRLQTDAV